MSTLVLELKQGETLLVNGAVIRFKTRARVELYTQARFMFGKQIMLADEAISDGQRIYFDLQTSYVGPEDERAPALASARGRIAALASATTALPVKARLAQITEQIDAGNFFEALKHARQLIIDEAQNISLSP